MAAEETGGQAPGVVRGAWLVAQSKATPSTPTISIFLKPPGVIPPGGSTTICCSCQRDNGNFVLYKNGRKLRSLELRGSRAEFSISNATRGDTGAYNCHYLDGGTVLARSETLEKFRLPKPVFSVLPGHEVAAGAYVIFHCTIAHSKAGCFLYLGGSVENPGLTHEGTRGLSTSPMCIKAMGAAYSCQCVTRRPYRSPIDTGLLGYQLEGQRSGDTCDYTCQPQEQSYVSSQPSGTVWLAVADYTWSNVVRLALGAGVLVLLGLIVAEAIHSHWRRLGPR
ncbi:osteoclast-associated immunoglobulin-like receptor [Cariama cristata]